MTRLAVFANVQHAGITNASQACTFAHRTTSKTVNHHRLQLSHIRTHRHNKQHVSICQTQVPISALQAVYQH